MAGCCPSIPASAAVGSAFSEANGPESDIRPGESVECYMVRGGNTSGLHDDATENALDRIENTSIPLTRTSSSVSFDNIQFKLTDGSPSTPTSWSWANDGGASLGLLGVSLTSGGLLNGTISAGAYNKTFKVVVTVIDGSGTIDSRGFTFAPSVGDSGTELRLISPLPGGIVNSKFGPRVHPITGVMKAHTGIDMKMSDRSVIDVVAAADGEVTLAGGDASSGYGIRVHIKHFNASGVYLCSTTYNHLAKVYVTVGQRVMAGQTVGLEGTTGSSTGNHLHFECRLPDGKFIDPEPLINGSLQVAGKTLANGDADPSSISTKNSSASLSASEVDARQDSCRPFGTDYQEADPPETTDAVPVYAPTDPFEEAWYFTMSHEVGPFWASSPAYSPGDPDVDAGAIDTTMQRRKTGYVNTPNYPGGETKFGIAQNPNPRTIVTTMDYEEARLIGFNNYWKSARMPCTDKGALVAVMLFDMNYLHGDGNSKKIYQNSGITSTTGDSNSVQLAHCQALYNARVAFINTIPRPQYTRGWLKRAADCLTYIQGL